MDLSGLISSILRQRVLFLGVVASVFLLGAVIIFMLPNIYVSTARILIERPNTYAVTDVQRPNDNLSQRTHAIMASVSSTANVLKVMERQNLIDPGSPEEDQYQAVEQFRDQMSLSFDNVAVINQYTGKSGMFSMGLLVEYKDKNADVAYAVTKELTDAVLEANSGKGQQSAEFRHRFLTEQAEQLSDELTLVDKKMAAFKQQNALFLPEVHTISIRRLDELENQIERSKENISRLRREDATTSADLATASTDALLYAADGTRILGADEKLRLLEVDYAAASSRYSSDHPEVQRLAREIAGMKAHVGSRNTAGMEAELLSLREQLARASDRYTAAHPDIKSLQRKIRQLELELRAAVASNAPRSTSAPSNPAYNRFLVRQQAVRDDLVREQQLLNSLNADISAVQEQLARMPAVEQQLATLERERLNTQNRYQEVQAELANAKLRLGMREADLLEKFVLVEPPIRAFKPSSPKKKILLPVLLVLSVATGLLVVAARHIMQDKLWRSKDVEALLDAPVLLVPKFR